jgi:hypothetical protein
MHNSAHKVASQINDENDNREQRRQKNSSIEWGVGAV